MPHTLPHILPHTLPIKKTVAICMFKNKIEQK